MIEGGTGGNVIPASCTIVATRRIVPGEDATEVYHRLAAIAEQACPLPTEITWPYPAGDDGRLGSEAFYQPADTPLAQALAAMGGHICAASHRSAPTPCATPAWHARWPCSDPDRSTTPTKPPKCVAIDGAGRVGRGLRPWLDPG